MPRYLSGALPLTTTRRHPRLGHVRGSARVVRSGNDAEPHRRSTPPRAAATLTRRRRARGRAAQKASRSPTPPRWACACVEINQPPRRSMGVRECALLGPEGRRRGDGAGGRPTIVLKGTGTVECSDYAGGVADDELKRSARGRWLNARHKLTAVARPTTASSPSSRRPSRTGRSTRDGRDPDHLLRVFCWRTRVTLAKVKFRTTE